ncbi:MAG: hypothetical protein N2999_05795 [Proteobacteria bacterium]|nr:hypothetical protein [Pseudomonadota bacterium]
MKKELIKLKGLNILIKILKINGIIYEEYTVYKFNKLIWVNMCQVKFNKRKNNFIEN